MSLLYRYVSPDCPDFKTTFKGVEHSMVCDVHKLDMVFHKTALWTLANSASFIAEK